MSVLTEKEKNNNNQNNHLFENNFAYVTRQGEVILKETNLFKERKLATVEPETAREQVEAYQKAFSELESSFNSFFDDMKSPAGTSIDQLKNDFETLVEKAAGADAIGDFENLVADAREKFNRAAAEAKAGDESKQEENEKPVPLPDPEPAEVAAKTEIAEEKKEDPVEETPGKEEAAAEEAPEPEPEADKTDVKEAETEEPEADADVRDGKEEMPEPEKEPVAEESPTEDEEAPEQDEAADTEEETSDEQEEKDREEDAPEGFYKKLADKAETLSELKDWSYATMEFENINLQWGEGPDIGGADIKPYRQKIDALREELEQKKKAHYEEQKRIREENLEKKKELLAQLKQIIDDKKWTLTREISKIKNRWEQIKPIPASEQEKLDSAFRGYIRTFDDHKVDRLVKQKQQEEDNLTGKLVILEKIEMFLEGVDESSDWDDLDKKLSEYSRQFRKIGRIPSEKNQEVWDRFHSAQDVFHSMRFKHDKPYRKNIEKFLAKKKKLVDEAEALVDSDDLADAARKVNKLHRRWKKIGNLPQKDENELWDRFKAATDTFNEKKSENIDKLREQEDENYKDKLGLIKEAEELKDSEEWEKTHKEYQRLMDRWKAAGPVPRRKSGKIWKQFKGTMDHFYNRRREFFKEVKSERKDNLKEKEDILDQLKELKTHENPIEAVEIAKPLQEEFKKAGYVPIQHKNRMWKEYRETCDVIYERFRTAKSAAQIVGKENVEHFSTDDIVQIKKKQDQADRLRKEVNSLSSDLIQMKESLSYFKPSSKGSSLLDEVKSKIDKAEQSINNKEEKLQELEVEIDKLKKDA